MITTKYADTLPLQTLATPMVLLLSEAAHKRLCVESRYNMYTDSHICIHTCTCTRTHTQTHVYMYPQIQTCKERINQGGRRDAWNFFEIWFLSAQSAIACARVCVCAREREHAQRSNSNLLEYMQWRSWFFFLVSFFWAEHFQIVHGRSGLSHDSQHACRYVYKFSVSAWLGIRFSPFIFN